MSKHVYLPVCVDEDGTFRVDFDGAPWMYVDAEDNVWNEENMSWESGRLESPNAGLEAFATAQIARAARVLASLEAWEAEHRLIDEDVDFSGSGGDHAEFLYELVGLLRDE